MNLHHCVNNTYCSSQRALIGTCVLIRSNMVYPQVKMHGLYLAPYFSASMLITDLQIRFSYFTTERYAMGPQKNHLNEMVLLSTQNTFKLMVYKIITFYSLSRGAQSQSVTSLTADPGFTSSIPARSHACVEIDHEIISRVISSFGDLRRVVS